MPSQLIITVTSVEGRPRLALPASTTTDQVREFVAQRFGMHAPEDSWMRPHDFCGQLVPPPSRPACSTPQPSYGAIQSMCSPVNRRGHLRGF